MAKDYGPNSTPVAAFLSRLPRLTLEDFAVAIRRWRDALRKTDAWYAAEDAVGDALAHTGRHDAEWRLHDDLHQLFRETSWQVARDAAARAPATDAAAQYLAASAAFALLLIDALPPAHVATLYAPFAELIPLGTLGIRAPRAPERDGRRGLPS